MLSLCFENYANSFSTFSESLPDNNLLMIPPDIPANKQIEISIFLFTHKKKL